MRTSKTRVLRFGIFAVLASTLAFACAEEEKKKDDDDEGGGGSATTTTTTSAGVGGSATTTTTTSTTATTSTTSGGPFTCVDISTIQVDQGGSPCPNPDQAACECGGCLDNGVCISETELDDCVCPDCATDSFCTDPSNCNNDGSCDPFNEGCGCADCANHPNCN